MEIHGIGFLTADKVALKVGIARNAPERLRAGGRYAVRTAVEQEGHCAMPQEELARVATGFLECKIQEAESTISCEIKVGGGLSVIGSAERNSCFCASYTMRSGVSRRICGDSPGADSVSGNRHSPGNRRGGKQGWDQSRH